MSPITTITTIITLTPLSQSSSSYHYHIFQKKPPLPPSSSSSPSLPAYATACFAQRTKIKNNLLALACDRCHSGFVEIAKCWQPNAISIRNAHHKFPLFSVYLCNKQHTGHTNTHTHKLGHKQKFKPHSTGEKTNEIEAQIDRDQIK